MSRIAARLRRFLTSSTTFLEIGAGDLALTLEIAPLVARAYAVEVSNEVAGGRALPANVELVLSDASSISIPDDSVDLAFSNQLLEHLHPDDALDHLHDVARALKSGGRYVCLTPSRVSGPHDISMYFSDRPTGLHLREYATTELVRMFKDAGFSKVGVPAPVTLERVVVVPAFVVTAIESLLGFLPRRTARALAASRLLSPLLGRVIATR